MCFKVKTGSEAVLQRLHIVASHPFWVDFACRPVLFVFFTTSSRSAKAALLDK